MDIVVLKKQLVHTYTLSSTSRSVSVDGEQDAKPHPVPTYTEIDRLDPSPTVYAKQSPRAPLLSI